MTDTVKTGRLIAELRKRYGMTQAELGEKLSVSPQAVSKWEIGQSFPDTCLLVDLASALFTSVDFLLRGDEESRYARTVKAEDVARGVECLAEAGRLMGTDNTIWQGMAEGVKAKMNTDLEELLSTDYLREAAVSEIICQNLMDGAYVSPEEIRRTLKHEHWITMLLTRCERYGIPL